MGWSDRVKTFAIVEELMKECGYNGSPRPGLPSAWKLRHFIHEDNDKIWVYIMDDSNTSIRLWRDPNSGGLGLTLPRLGAPRGMYTEKTRSQRPRTRSEALAQLAKLGMLAAGIGIASSKVIDLTDPNSMVKVKKFLNKKFSTTTKTN